MILPCDPGHAGLAAPAGRLPAPDITFGKVDTEDQPELSAAAQVSSITTPMSCP